MIPQDKNQPGPAGVVKIWGHPWHGLVEDGVLALPNAATMPYPAPTAAGEADVLAFVVPGTPPVTRSTEQAADDTAAGRQWLDYALISGRYQRRLYGQVIGGNGTWLYVAPDGSRWRATLAGVPGVQDLTAPWATTLTLERFGAFGAPAESHALPVSLADWQQAIPGHAGGDYALDAFGDVSAANVEVEDVRRDGSAALLGVQINLPNNSWGPGDDDPLERLLLGTVEMTISGTPGVDADATLAVRHSRAQALGSATQTGAETYLEWGYVYIDEAPEDSYWRNKNVSVLGVRAYVGDADVAITRTGRVLAAGYTAAGSIGQITLDVDIHSVSTGPMPPGGANPMRTTAATETGSITLSGPGGMVTIVLERTEAREQTVVNGFYTTESITEMISVGPLIDANNQYSEDQSYPRIMSAPVISLFGLPPDSDGASVFGGSLYLGVLASGNWYAGIRRYSATCLELLLAVWDNVLGEYTAWHHLGAVGVAGGDTGAQTTPDERPYGTAHPVTGAIERVRDVPVVWV